MPMLAEFSIEPLGAGPSVGEHIAEVMKIVDGSGLSYKLNPMGTVVEGGWEEVISLIRKCHEAVMGRCERAVTTIRIDDRRGKTGVMESKVRSVEERLHKALKK